MVINLCSSNTNNAICAHFVQNQFVEGGENVVKYTITHIYYCASIIGLLQKCFRNAQYFLALLLLLLL